MAITIDFPTAKKLVHDLDPKLSELDEGFKAAVVLILAAAIGPYPRAIHNMTGYQRHLIEEFITRCKTNGVMDDDYVFGNEWLKKKSGTVAFWLDVMVATGEVEKVG